jgi:hypothetical protein
VLYLSPLSLQRVRERERERERERDREKREKREGRKRNVKEKKKERLKVITFTSLISSVFTAEICIQMFSATLLETDKILNKYV